jgi:hypothetical protein
MKNGKETLLSEGQEGQRPRCGLNLGDAKRHLGV